MLSKLAWCFLILAVSVIEGLSIIYIWPPSEFIRQQPMAVRLLLFLVPVLVWELFCRNRLEGSLRFDYGRTVVKFFFAGFLMAMLTQMGEKFAGLDLVDYRGTKDPLPDWVVPLYTKHALIRAFATLIALSSIAWSESALKSVLFTIKRGATDVRWRRALAGILLVVIVGGAIKIFLEAGFAAVGNLYFHASFTVPCLFALSGMLRVRNLRGVAILLGASSAAIWIGMIMRHAMTYHASIAFFDWSFVLFGLLVIGLSACLTLIISLEKESDSDS